MYTDDDEASQNGHDASSKFYSIICFWNYELTKSLGKPIKTLDLTSSENYQAHEDQGHWNI